VAAKSVDKVRMMAPGGEGEKFGFLSDATEYRYRRHRCGCHVATIYSVGKIKRGNSFFVVVAQLKANRNRRP
jgi:hypothetical protein